MLTIGWEHHQAGRYEDADRVCREVLRVEPEDPAAWHLLGLVQFRLGRLDEAESAYRQALALRPESAPVHGDLGVLLATRGRLAEALEPLRRAVALAPESVEAHGNLGMALFQLGRPDEAAASLRQAIRCNPDHPMAPSALGYLLSAQGKFREMAEVFRSLVRLRPDHLVAHLRLGEALVNLEDFQEARGCFEVALRLAPEAPEAHLGLGLVLINQDQFEAALPPLRRAAALAPERPEAQALLERALRGLGRLDEALAAAEQVLRLQPDDADGHCVRAYLLDDLGRVEEAVAGYDRAIQLNPGHSEAHHNRGVALGRLARYEEAIAAFDEAIRLRSDYAEAWRNRALARLTLGDLERGWADLEWGWARRLLNKPPCPLPLWTGEPLQGRTILLHEDQGLGDAIQFVRYAAAVKARGGRVIVVCKKPLAPLFQTCPGVDQIVVRGEPLPECDVHSSLVRLMGLFTRTLDAIPAPVPYLRADPVRMDRWRQRLAAWPGFQVGIAWQGNPRHTRDRDRSFPLALFERLARIEGVRLISLQKGYGSEQLRELGDRFPVVDLGDEVDPGLETMEDTPALMMSLDLVITPDTSLAHLAGALGVPIWIPLPRSPDWRWFLERDESPWYPTARLFRQTARSQWGPVFDRIAAALEHRIASAAAAAPAQVSGRV